MPGLPFAHCCSFSTAITFLRFASQIFFCYREKVIHFLTIELYYIINIMTWRSKLQFFSTCLSWYTCNCSPLQPTVTWQFQSGGNSSKVLPLQPFAASSYISILVRGNSSKFFSLQSIAAHSYVAILIRG